MRNVLLGAAAVAALGLGGSLAACSRTDVGSDGIQPSPGVASPMPITTAAVGDAGPSVFDQGNSESDLQITGAVRRFVVKDLSLSAGAENVAIITRGGHVVLRGEVKSASEKQAIDERAKSLPGVVDVDNQIVVKP